MLRVYDEFLEDEKITNLRDRSYRLHVSALVYCSRNLTDGELTERAVKVLQAILGYPVKRHVAELVACELWIPIEVGYRIRNYLDFNPDAATVKKERSKARDRMRKLRENRAGSREPSAECSPERDAANGSDAVPVQSSPVPLRRPLKAVTADGEIETEIDKLMRHIKNPDEGTRGVLVALARRLPLASVAKVRESCQSRTVGAGYAVNALKSELADIEEVA
jgi:hypothetical protein